MKYLDGLFDMKNRYKDILRQFDNERYGEYTLTSWGIKMEEKEQIEEEKEVLHFLLSCEGNLAHGTKAIKPSIEAANRCFHRYLKLLNDVDGCDAKNVKTYPDKLVQREYNTCRHYLFQFSLPAWYEKLPSEVLTYEEKYNQRKETK